MPVQLGFKDAVLVPFTAAGLTAEAAEAAAAVAPALVVHSAFLEHEGDVLATAVGLARSRHGVGSGALRIMLPSSTPREAQLLLAPIYAGRELKQLADSLPAPRLYELAGVAHRLQCTSILAVIDKAMVDKCKGKVGRRPWLTPANVLWALRFGRAFGLSGLQEKAAVYVADNLGRLSLDSKACAAGDESLVLVLQHLRDRLL